MPSTAIEKIDYDEKTQTLLVSFVANGRRYAYRNVPAEIHDAFRRSGSKGRYFNTMIRDAYDCDLVFDPKASAGP